MTKILATIDWYLPGFKAGGPVRTVSNLVELLREDFEFFIVTRDRDLHDTQPYPSLPLGTWTKIGAAQVYYSGNLSLRSLRRRIAEIAPDIIYLNSFFSRISIRILLLRWLRLIPRCAVVLAPRGEFSQGARSIKRRRKWLYMKVALPFLYRQVLWQASTEQEAEQIKRALAGKGDKPRGKVALARNVIHVAPDVPGMLHGSPANVRLRKEPGSARIVFLARISRMKNPRTAIELSCGLRGDITFDIYGPLEDPALWAECQDAMKQAPANVKISYRGPVAPDRVQAILGQYHLFVLPTLGENFGHVILEALGAGCPVVISDQTPWSQLQEKGVGWTLPLDHLSGWRQALQSCVDMENTAFTEMSERARRFAREFVELPGTREEYIDLFTHAISLTERT
ncbi:MAG: glycosyltransferase family 4 protein [Acidobacteriia bacterium]|nr:glycosyltransferase family 4 protein [Terriglobia bacterium]